MCDVAPRMIIIATSPTIWGTPTHLAPLFFCAGITVDQNMDHRLPEDTGGRSETNNFISDKSFSFRHLEEASQRAQQRHTTQSREDVQRRERKCFCCQTPSFTHRHEGCLWKLFSWAWLLFAFPLKTVETLFVGHPMIALQRLIKHYHWQFIAGVVYAWCWIMALIYPVYMYNPARACPIYTSSALWCTAHLLVRLVCAQLDPGRIRLLNWGAQRRRAVYELVPIHIAYYTGLCCCMVLVYPMFATPPPNQIFLDWCTLTPGWQLPNGVMFAMTVLIAQLAAIIQVTPPTPKRSDRTPHWTHNIEHYNPVAGIPDPLSEIELDDHDLIDQPDLP